MNHMSEKPFKREFNQLELTTSQDEYRRGEAPLHFKHELSNGATLKFEQDDAGIANVQILRGSDVVFDACNELPADWKLVTPTYLLNNRGEAESDDFTPYDALWRTSFLHKNIRIGDIDDPKELLIMLHEIGHAIDPARYEMAQSQLAQIYHWNEASNPDEKGKAHIQFAYTIAADERRAWAYAILRLRKIISAAEIDMKEFFPTFENMRDYIHTFLDSYKNDVAEGAAQSDFERLLGDSTFEDELEKAFHGKGVQWHENTRN